MQMDKSELFQIVESAYCQATMFERWDAVPGRFFTAYRTRHGFNPLLGNGVVDEFRTISGPILLAPSPLLGGIYDAGLQLADARDAEAPIDQGWPPLTVGIDVAAPDHSEDWMAQLLNAIQQQKSSGSALWENTVFIERCGDYCVQILQCSVAEEQAATVVATDAPMLPQQLARLADFDMAPITIAVSVGNRLPRVSANEFHQVDVISEEQLTALLAAARRSSR